ncbi:protein kinase domain-containing protein [Dactylosporangium sp. McL0621]|uniref:serine/threonine-protein kinase n=1 Tax=Dactylosporangium sp. McL0621 TaxID=3415678 RepID=UPI003CF7A6BE
MSDVWQGQILGGRYRLTSQLGAGGMAVVWKAHDELLNRHVAVKILDATRAGSPAARRRVQAEAQAAAQLSHPNVTSVYDYGEVTTGNDGPVPYVVMELLPGRTLSQRLAAGALPPRVALRICAEVAGALAAAHARHLVHRDVKPANVILTPSGAKVVDFGLAAVAGQPDLDEEGQLLGTPAYLAPERLINDEVRPASDVYALGLLIHRALTNRLPWLAETTTQMIDAHVYVEPDPLPPVSGVLPEVNEVCNRCLAKDPDARPSAAEVAAVLADAAGIVPPPIDDLPEPDAYPSGSGDTPVATEPGPDGQEVEPPATGSGPLRRHRRAVAAAVVGALVLAAVITSALALSGDEPEAGPRADAQSEAPAVSPAPSSAGPPAPSARPTPSAVPAGPGAPATSATAGPASPPPGPVTTPAVTTTPPETPPGPGAPVRSAGGVAWVLCDGKKAQIARLDLAPGYATTQYQPGPADGVKAVLDSVTNRSEINVRCMEGKPAATVKETPKKA